jgi:hypothetical protein
MSVSRNENELPPITPAQEHHRRSAVGGWRFAANTALHLFLVPCQSYRSIHAGAARAARSD